VSNRLQETFLYVKKQQKRSELSFRLVSNRLVHARNAHGVAVYIYAGEDEVEAQRACCRNSGSQARDKNINPVNVIINSAAMCVAALQYCPALVSLKRLCYFSF
jgi:hypothetical protein